VTATTQMVRIIAVPPGEAPLWVREKWVGLELPLVPRYPREVRAPTLGVISGPTGIFGSLVAWLTGRTVREAGFLVRVTDAIAVLELKHPEAAAWWRANTPGLVRKNKTFLFHSIACQPLPGRSDA
jgi:hypothetical protein